MPETHHVILDTDIGSDVDDALALAQILGTEEIDLLGVTTVYGDVLLRARLARRLASLAGRDIAVHAGIGEPRSGREVWWAGHEGSLHADLETEHVDPLPAVDFLTQTVLARPGEIDVIAIGPLTNIAAAIEVDGFAEAVRHLWIMGGAFTDDEVEHNLRSDVAAAERVFAAGIPTTITGLEVTRRLEIRADQLGRIAGAGPLGASLQADVQQWWDFWNEEWNVPHDPVTVLTMLRPELFAFGPVGRISLVAEGEHEGRSTFHPDPSGSIRVALSVDATAAAESIVAAIIAASPAPAA
ncbi:nucleoside hydrolase [Leifsonia poae]|uniref:nucleoside hydrolase n=1 Tax=Leifsonia poae TaxID=110933 RepID=UPI001CBF2673|nr:nucleoside hydrolase [Leifsonia poae]